MNERIGAIVLAAGRSRRMGRPKLLLPWGETTVIGQIILELHKAEETLRVVVVAGELREDILAAAPSGCGVDVAFNAAYAQGEMLSSLRVGLEWLPQSVEAALVVLGDQPQMQVGVVNQVVRAYRESGGRLVVPSFQMRRGHPWLVERSLWPDLVGLSAEETLRDFLTRHSGEIHYVNVDTASVLKDLDTPEDYESEKPPG